MDSLLYSPEKGEIRGGFKPPFARRGDYPKFYITDKAGRPIAFSDDLNDARNVAAILNEYVEMKKNSAHLETLARDACTPKITEPSKPIVFEASGNTTPTVKFPITRHERSDG